MSTLKHDDFGPICADTENIFPSSTVVFIMACIDASRSHSGTYICIDIYLNLRFGIWGKKFVPYAWFARMTPAGKIEEVASL